MRKILTAIIAILAFSVFPLQVSALDLSSIKFPELRDPHVPEVEKVVLPNGLRLYILEDHTLPLFRASVRVNGGSYLESPEQIGLSDITADLLREGGTEKWSPDELDELIESCGANLETYGDVISCGLSVNMLSRQTELAVELMAEVLRRPALDDSRFEQLMLSYKASIDRRNDSPDRIGSREFSKLIYGADSVYARHIEYATLANINTEKIKKFHELLYRPENTQISLYGDFDSAEIKKLIEKYFGDWEKGEKPLPPFPEVKYKDAKRLVLIDVPGAQQTSIYLGHLGGRRMEPDYPHKIIMNNILGVGFSSRLFNEIRTKSGLCYSVYGVYGSNFTYPGIFYNYTGTRPETTIKAITKIIEEIRKMQTEKPTEAELETAKKRYLNSFVFYFTDKKDTLGRVLSYDLFGVPADFLEQTRKAIEATTAEDVQKAALKSLNPDMLRILVVGDKSKFPQPLETLNYAPVEELDVTIKK